MDSQIYKKVFLGVAFLMVGSLSFGSLAEEEQASAGSNGRAFASWMINSWGQMLRDVPTLRENILVESEEERSSHALPPREESPLPGR